MKISSKTIKNFVLEKNRKVVFTPGPGSLLEENINGLGPFFGRGDEHYNKVEANVIKNLKTRETFIPTERGKKRQQYLDKIRKQDITKILSKDKRILDWWKSI